MRKIILTSIWTLLLVISITALFIYFTKETFWLYFIVEGFFLIVCMYFLVLLIKGIVKQIKTYINN